LTAYFDSEEPVLQYSVPIMICQGLRDPIKRAKSKNLEIARSMASAALMDEQINHSLDMLKGEKTLL
jgi:hypothetical protein